MPILRRTGSPPAARRIRLSAVIAAAILTFSLTLSHLDVLGLGEFRRVGQADGLSNRATAYKQAEDLESAERDARLAVSMAPNSAPARYNLAVIVEATGRTRAAERLYREALARSGYALAEAAANLARILIDRGAANEAIPLLSRSLELRPVEATCWNNLVVALMMTGQRGDALDAVRRAAELGVVLDPELVAIIGDLPSAPTESDDR